MSPVQASRFANHRSAGVVLRRLHHVLPVVALCLVGAMTPAAAQSVAPGGDQQPASTSAPTVTNGQAVQPSSAESQATQQPAAPATNGASASVPAAPVSASPDSAPATAPVATPAENTSGNEAAQAPQSVSPAVQQSGQASEQMLGQPVTPVAGPQEADLPPLPAMTPPETGGLHDLSPWGMFMQADIVVKAVMVGLALASLATWTVWLAKSLELSFARRRVRRSLEVLRRASTLNEAESGLRAGQRGRGTVFTLVEGALDEAKRSGDLPADGVKERAAILLRRIEGRAGRRMMIGTGILASIGSTSPFIGLFGTVWGIMNSFIGIAESNTTNLAVVAPGIAEALLATAIGLVAAIPAVIIYNIFARSISGYKALLGDASAEILRHLSRDLDRRAHGREQPAHRLATGQVASLRSAAE